jgi:hypothetical protein
MYLAFFPIGWRDMIYVVMDRLSPLILESHSCDGEKANAMLCSYLRMIYIPINRLSCQAKICNKPFINLATIISLRLGSSRPQDYII